MTTNDRPTLDQMQEHLRLLWYSDPGGGKTTNIAEAARYGKVVYVDSENGLKARALKQHGIPVENIEPRLITTYRGMIDFHQEMLERLASGEDIFAVAWDTASKTSGSLLDAIGIESARKDKLKGERAGKDEWLIKSEDDIYQDDYGVLGTQMRRIIRRLHGLDCHLLIGCHQRKDKDDDGAVVVGPALSPAVRGDLVGYMDVVIHCEVNSFGSEDDEEFSGLCRPRGVHMAKDRFGSLPVRLIDPNFTRVLGYIDGTIDRDKDPRQIAARRRREALAASKVQEAPANGDSTVEEAKEEETAK
jgi:hypothetical protein